MLLTHTALQLANRFIVMLEEPLGQVTLKNAEVVNAAPEKNRTQHGDVCSYHKHFITSCAVWIPLVAAKLQFIPP